MLIGKSALSRENARTPAYFYDSARDGMRDLLMRGRPAASGSDGVLLPGYIGWSAREGSGVFDPIRESGRPYSFYRLRGDLSVDIDDLERALASGGFQYVVVIHYFGRLNSDMPRVRELTEAAGAVLVEDLAHGFFSAMREPEALRGQVAVYSLHKQFSMPEGGMVVYRDPSLLLGQRSSRPELAGEVLSYDWHEISCRRRRNFELITSELMRLGDETITLIWHDLKPNEVPQTLPVILKTADRDRVYAEMNAAGFGMVSLYHTLIPEASGIDEPVGRIARTIINFPVHQDLNPAHIPALVETFKTAASRHSGGE